MALVSFGYRVDMNTIAPPTNPAGYIVAYDLDGILKQKDHLGVISLVGSGTSGTSGSSGTSGVDGIAGGQIFYFNQSVAGYTASYKELGNSPVISSEEIITKTLGPTESNVLMSSYISDSLGLTVIPGGVQRFSLHYKKGASQSTMSTYAVVQLANQNGDKYYDLGATQAISYSNTQDIGWENDNVVNISLDIISITTEIQATDRIVISLYTNNLDTTTQSVSFYTEGLNNYSYVQTSTAVVPGPKGATGFGVTSSFYLQGTNDYSYDTTSDIYRTGSLNIGTGTASDGRFIVSSSGGTLSLLVNDQGDTIFSGDTKISGQTFSDLPPGSITFGNKTSIYSTNNAEIVIGSAGSDYSYNYGWKFTDHKITNLYGNQIEVQNTIGTIGNLWIGSNYTFAGYGLPVSQQSTLFVKGTTSSIMKVVGTGATWSNSDSIFSIEDSGKVSIGPGTSSSTDRFVVSSTTGSVSLVVSENGSIYNGSLFDLKYGYNSLPSFGKLPIDEYGDLNNGTGYTPGYYTASTSFVSGPYTLNVYPVVYIYVDELGEAYILSVVSIGSGWVDDGHSMVFTADIPGGSDYSFYLYLLPGFNTAIGNYSLSSNTTGSYNMAFGHKSLYTNTIGTGNMAFGHQSLYTNTGSDNTAIGNYSLSSNTTGNNNMAIGLFSLYYNTVGAGNMAISPLSALLYNTTGNANIALGEQSLRNNTIGSYNIGLGGNSLFSNTIGSNNIGIGNDSGAFTAPSTESPIYGIQATMSNNSIFIGTGTRPQLSDQTNQIVIGHGATGNGSNTVTLGADTITRTYLKGKVVIADGTQANGYVLISDADGVSSWTSSVPVLTDYNFKNIDSSLVSGTYSVLSTDYTKTLVYTGTSSINVVLSTGTTYSVGKWVNVLQKGAGQITIGANGFILSYSSDELPTTFGTNSLVTVFVYSTSSPELIVSGKLKLV